MKKLLSLIVVAAFLLFVGVWALSFSGNSQNLEVASSAVAPASLPAANNLNFIALPLNSTAQFAAGGFTYDLFGLMGFAGGPSGVGGEVEEVRVWDVGSQVFNVCSDPFAFGVCQESFDNGAPLSTSYSYWIGYNNTGRNVLSFVGDVPAPGTQFSITGGTPCQTNDISIPLDQAAFEGSDAYTLLLDIAGGAGSDTSVASWDAINQVFSTCSDPFFFGVCQESFDNGFATRIGYPVRVCNAGATSMWP